MTQGTEHEPAQQAVKPGAKRPAPRPALRKASDGKVSATSPRRGVADGALTPAFVMPGGNAGAGSAVDAGGDPIASASAGKRPTATRKTPASRAGAAKRSTLATGTPAAKSAATRRKAPAARKAAPSGTPGSAAARTSSATKRAKTTASATGSAGKAPGTAAPHGPSGSAQKVAPDTAEPKPPKKAKPAKKSFKGNTSDALKGKDPLGGSTKKVKVAMPKRLRKAAEAEARANRTDLDTIIAGLLRAWLNDRG